MKTLAIFWEASSNEDEVPQGEQPQNAVKSLQGVFSLVIQECLRFKTKAALSGAYYEVHFLPSGTKYDSKKMTLATPPAGSSASKKGKTMFCLLPSVIKYQTKLFKDCTLLSQDIGSFGEFINRQDGQRTDGAVLFQPLVTLQ